MIARNDDLEFHKILEFIAGYTITDLGKEKILTTLSLDSKEDIIRSGNLITEAKNLLIENDIPPINYLPNLNEVLSRAVIEGSILSIEQIRSVLDLSVISRQLLVYLKNNAQSTSLYNDFSHLLFIDKVFENHIDRIFTDSNEIKDTASNELKEIRKNIIDKSEQLRKTVNRILKKLSEAYLVQEEFVTLRDERIVLPIKAEHKRHVRGFIHSESATGQTVYIEPEETLELNNEILSLRFAEKREVERILKSITKYIGSNAEKLKHSLDTVCEIDAVFAKAKYSLEIIGAFPTLNDGEKIKLIDARHPLLLKKLGREKTVPLNFEIDKQRVIIITGPNAGGKTVVLKTIGLLTLMLKAGLHLPIHPDSNFKLFEKILIDIGDRQSLEDDLSTFSSHLTNIKSILSKADNKSLVLIDEIGTGTDPAEGAALAAAILIKLSQLGALVLSTTHHGSLKLVANEQKYFENSSMIFDSGNLKPTYIFSQGTPGSSYAFEVAEKIGFEREMIDLSKEHLDVNKNKVEDFLIELEKKSNSLNEKLKTYERENVRLTGLANLYSRQIEKFEKERKTLLSEAKENAERYLKDVNRKVENVIKKIVESNAAKEVVKAEREKIEAIKNEHELAFEKIKTKLPAIKKEFSTGDRVLIKNTNTTGEIIMIKGEKILLDAGTIKINVTIDEIEHTERKEVEIDNYNSAKYSAEYLPSRLDIRGKKPEEADLVVLKYIDNAYTNNVNRVEILHGKGNGVLKKMVKDLLAGHDVVKGFYYAPIEQGGEGITIVELK